MADAYVQVAVDGAGKKIANQEVLRQDGSAANLLGSSTTVERQEVVHADPYNTGPEGLARVEGGRVSGYTPFEQEQLKVLYQIRFGIGQLTGQDLSSVPIPEL